MNPLYMSISLFKPIHECFLYLLTTECHKTYGGGIDALEDTTKGGFLFPSLLLQPTRKDINYAYFCLNSRVWEHNYSFSYFNLSFGKIQINIKMHV